MGAASLFVVHTPFQRFAAQHMLRAMPELFAGYKRAILISSQPGRLGADRALWDDLMIAPHELIDTYTPARMRNAWEWARTALDGLEGYERIDIHVSNVDILLANAFLAMCRSDRSHLRLCVYPEGLGTLIRPRMRPGKRLKNLAKSAWGRVAGAPYMDYGNDFAGAESASVIYSFVPGLPAAYAAKVIQIPVPQAGLAEVKPGWLVLGDSNAFMPSNVSAGVVQGLIDYVASRQCGALLYKPHHHGTGRDRSQFLAAGYTIVDDPRPVEEVFLENPVSNVIAVISSALLHLKVFYGDRINCTAYRMNIPYSYSHSRSTRVFDEVYGFLKGHGVEMID